MVTELKGRPVFTIVLFAFAMMMLNLGGAAPANAQTAIPVPPPPMGWSSWNSFSNTVDAKIAMAQADAMAANGMAKAGYQYVNIDEGWWLGRRDAGGNIIVDANAWPALAPGEQAGDMANIVRYIHSKGLKAGIYTDAGMDGCSMYPDLGPPYRHVGSEGHYEQDFLQFAKWGFDYVKVDWCGGDKEKLDPAVQYAEIARAIGRVQARTGRRLYFSICEWGKNSPWTWAPNVGGAPADIWRTSGDIVPPIVPHHKHSGRLASFTGMLANFDQGVHPEAEHTGFYNDPDMMVVGMPGLTEAQNRVHMSLWAISAAPLIVGADLTTLSPAALATLTNPEAISIDQDSLGLQGVKVATYGDGLEVWSKALDTPGERAVLLLNRTGDPADITVHWSDLGLQNASTASVRDVWARKDLGTFNSSYSAHVQSNDGALLIVRGREARLTEYAPAASEGPGTDREVVFTNVSSRVRIARVRIAYRNLDHASRIAELRVNGQIPTRIAFPPTGSAHAPGTVWIQAIFDGDGAKNVLDFSPTSDSGLRIDSIAVE